MIRLDVMEMLIKRILTSVLLAMWVLDTTAQNTLRPILRENFTSWTSHADLKKWLLQYASESSDLILDTTGTSFLGRTIVTIQNREVRVGDFKVMVIAEQHGDEPSAMEAALWLVEQLEELKKIHGDVHFVIVPMVNPDGHEQGTRRNGRKQDLNRDHLLLLEKETQWVHQLYQSYLPHVFIDIHEYPLEVASATYPWEKRTREQLGVVTNTNFFGTFHRAFSKDVVLPYVAMQMAEEGISFSEYAVGSIAKSERVRHSTVDIDDARQGLGALGGSLSFIIEGLNGRQRNDSIQQRVEGQVAILNALLSVVLKNKDRIVKEVERSRELDWLTESVSITMDHFVDGLCWPVQLHHTGHEEVVNVCYPFYQSAVMPIKEIDVPLGYLIPKSDTLLNEWLDDHGILKERNFGPVLSTGAHVQEWVHKGWKTVVIEGMEVPGWEGQWSPYLFDKNTYLNYWYVSAVQASLKRVVMALEPESMFGLVRYEAYSQWRARYPILRIDAR